MARSIINELKEFVNEQTRGVGPVANLEGVIVATATVDNATPQTQQWFVAEVPASALPDYNRLLAAFTYERPGALNLDADAAGAVMYPTSGAALSDGHAVFFTGTARLPNKRSLVLRVRGEGASLAIFVDGAQVATDVDTLAVTLDLTAGDHQVLIAAFGGIKPITVESSADVAIARVEPVPRAPIWMKFPTVFTIEPDKGTSLVRMSWVNDPLAASWNLYRIDTSLLGAVVGTPVLNGDGTMTLVVAGLLTSLVVGSFLSTPYFDIGTVATITVGASNTTLVVNLVTVTEPVLTNWTGVNVYLAGAMTAIASVSNAGASVVQYDDSKAKRNSLYIYRVTAVGAFGNTESNFSLPYSIWTNDDEPPAGIDSVSAPLITQDGYLVTVKYQSPVDPDFAGVRVYGPYALSGGNLSAPAAFLPANAVASQPGSPGRWETVQFKVDPAQPNMGYYFATYDQMGNEQKPAAFTVRRTGTARAAAFGYKYTGPTVPDWSLNPATVLAGVDSTDARNTATVTVLTLKVYPAAATLAVYLDAVLLTSATQSLNGRTYPAVTLKNTFSDRKEYEVVLTRIQGVPQTLIAGVSGTGLQPTSVTYKLDEDKNPGGQVTVDDFKAQPIFNLSYDENVKTIVVKRSGVVKTTLNRTTGLAATGKGTTSYTVASGDAIGATAADAGWTVEYTANGAAVVMWSGSLHGILPPPPRFDYISAVVNTAATPSYNLACKIIDPSGLGGTLSVWLNPTGATAAVPTAAADGTLTIAAASMPFTATSATVFTNPASALLNNVKASFTTPKTVYFEYVNTAGISTGKVEFQISGDLGTVLNADGSLKQIGAANLASSIRAVTVYATLPTAGQGVNGDIGFATDTGRLYRKIAGAWVSYTAAANLEGQLIGTQIADNAITATQINDLSISTPKLAANAVTAGKILARTITANEILANTITANEIHGNTITANELAADSATFGKVAAAAANFTNTVTSLLTARAIDAGKINVTQLSDFKVLQFAGKISVATGSATSTVTVTTNAGASPGWTANQWANAKLAIADALGVPVGEYTVASNTANTITITGTFGVALTTAMTFSLSNGAGLGIFVGGRLNSVLTDGSGNPSAYLDLNATATNPLLFSTAFQLNADGSATYSGNVLTNALTTDQLSTTNATISGTLTATALKATTFTMLDSNINLKIATAVTAGATSATMKDTAGNAPNWGTDQLAGSTLLIAGITYPIIGNSATAVTISSTFPALAVDTVVTLKNSFNGVWGTYTGAPTGALTQNDSAWNTATSTVSRSTTGTTTATTSANNVLTTPLPSISGQYTVVFSATLDTSAVQAVGLTSFSEVTVDLISDVFAKVNGGTPQYLYSQTIEHYIYSDAGGGTVVGQSETQTFTNTVGIAGVTTGLEIVVTPRLVYTRNGRGTGNASGSMTGGNISWQTGGTAGATRRTLRLFTRHVDGFSPAMVIEPIPALPSGVGRAGDIINVAGNLYVHSGSGWVIAGQGAVPSTFPWSGITGTPTTLAAYGLSGDAYTKVQSDANYPTKTGTGASGSWGISITGNAATATTATTASAVAGTNITGTTLASSIITSSLQSVGTLSTLTVSGALNANGTLNLGTNIFVLAATGTPAAPTFTTRSTGTRFVYYPNIGASALDYAAGIESGNLWWSSSGGYKWYINSTTAIMTLSGTTLTVPTVSANLTGNVTGNVAGNVTGTVLTASQPNITALGALLSLTVSGSINTGQGAGIHWFNGATDSWMQYQNNSDTSLYIRDLVNTRMQVQFTPGATSAAATTSINSQVSVGGLLTAQAGLSVTGTATATAFSGPLTGNVAGNLTGTVLTASQTNITALGTLLGLTSSAALQSSQNGAGGSAPAWKVEYISASPVISRLVFGTDNSGWQFAIASASGGTVTNRMTVSDQGTVTAALFSGNVSGNVTGNVVGSLTGTVLTAAQPNITSLGTINSLVASGFTASGSIVFNAQMQLAGNGTKFLFHSGGVEDWFVGTVGSTATWSIGTTSLADILTLTNTGGAALKGQFWVNATSNGMALSTQAVSGSIQAGMSLLTAGAAGGNLNIFARSDTGTAGQGVIISYYNGTVWTAALDVRNASGASTLNLMPAGGAVVTGADMRVGAQLFITGNVALNNAGGANAYHQLYDPSGGIAVAVGGTNDTRNYYSNTEHWFRDRARTTTWMTLSASALSIGVPVGINNTLNVQAVVSFSGTSTYGFIGTTQRANFGNVMVGANLTGVNGSDNYITPLTAGAGGLGYAGVEVRYGGQVNIYASTGATTAGATVTPSAIVTFASGGATFFTSLTVSNAITTQGTSGGYAFTDRASAGNPNWVLYANGGTARLWNGTNGDMLTVTTAGAVTAADFVLSSDRRLKQNIRVIDGALDKIARLSGNTYEMIADAARRRAGVIAQEVQEVLPEAVMTDEHGHLTVSYDSLVPLLIQGMKELRQEVNALREGR